MRSISENEKAGLVLAFVLIIAGLCMVVHPIKMFVFHPTDGPYVGSGDGAPQHVSKGMARVIGGGVTLFGVGFASIILRRTEK